MVETDPLATASGGRTWELIEDPAAPGAVNMAKDRWLMESVRRGGAPTLRLYGWSPPCLSLGRNQPSQHIPVDRLRDAGVEVVRRMTGGRAVLHDREITYSVAVRARSLGAPRAAYLRINEVLMEALRRAGVGVEMAAAGPGTAPIPSTAPCFAEPLPGELLLGGRKLVGSAQVHIDGVLLQHGSILLERSARLAEVEQAVGGEVEGECAYVRPEAGFVSSFGRILAEVWSRRIGAVERPGSPTPSPAELRPHLALFTDPDWTSRR